MARRARSLPRRPRSLGYHTRKAKSGELTGNLEADCETLKRLLGKEGDLELR
ncbi:MAG: hypothetical protein DDT37_00649 [Firmicutes bacterium]|nr:hypothetical protein [candidate division NPL-UPA2 bacterium]